MHGDAPQAEFNLDFDWTRSGHLFGFILELGRSRVYGDLCEDFGTAAGFNVFSTGFVKL